MTVHWNPPLPPPAASQRRRLPPALEEGAFLADEMSFETLLVLASDIAAQLSFDAGNGPTAGNWQRLFAKSEVTGMAIILSFDTALEQSRFRQAQSHGMGNTLAYLIALYANLDRWYRAFLPVHTTSADHIKLTIQTILKTQLVRPFQYVVILAQALDGYRQSLLADPRLTALDPLWGIRHDNGRFIASEQQQLLQQQLPGIQVLEEQLQLCFSAAINAVSQLQADCRSHLQQALSHADHSPEVALYLTFLTLFTRAQARLNRFTTRHLDFYYRRVLRQQPQPLAADAVFLKLTLESPSAAPVLLERGVVFSRGQDARLHDRLYCSDQPLRVTDAEVKQVHSLLLKRDPLMSPERELDFITAIHSDSLWPWDHQQPRSRTLLSLFGETPALQRHPSPSAPGFAIIDPVLYLPEGRRQVSLTVTLVDAQQSWLVQQLYLLRDASSPALLRKRLTTLLLTLAHAMAPLLPDDAAPALLDALTAALSSRQLQALQQSDDDDAISLLYQYFLTGVLRQTQDPACYCRALGHLFSRQCLSRRRWLNDEEQRRILARSRQLLPAASQLLLEKLFNGHRQASFYRLCSELFTLRISTENGWQPITAYRLHPLCADDDGRYGFRLTFTLLPGFDAVIPCDPALHGDIWHYHAPALQLAIKPETPFFPYSVLRDFVLGPLTLSTQVSGVRTLQLYTPDGQADAGKLFYPFGAQPVGQSALTIASYELARKQVQEVTLAIDWANLPGGSGGFRQHYRGYPGDDDNRRFNAQLSVLREGEWRLVGAPTALFAETAGSERLRPDIQLHADLKQTFQPTRPAIDADDFRFDHTSRNGMLRLSLCELEHAFGHHQYALLLSQTLLHNAKRRTPLPLPNPPYTPAINRLTLSYRACSRLYPGRTDPTPAPDSHLLHLHPFGHEVRYPAANGDDAARAVTFFPRYDDDGSLFIGLQASSLTGMLNLFFQLDDQAAPTAIRHRQAFQWCYLVDNAWRELPPHQVIADTTCGFITSGIITLELPPDINDRHTIMPDRLYWLRVSTRQGIGEYANCLHVATHVVRARRQWPQGQDDDDDVTPPPAVEPGWRALSPPAGLGPLSLMLPLNDGAPRESTRQFRQRVSERLRHKGRALTGWDYERLVLQHFADIEQVRCFPHTRFGVPGHHPGQVLLLVRQRHSPCRHQPCDALHTSAALLHRIQSWLQTIAPPGADIAVRSPVYDRVQVRCTVAFQPGHHPGQALRRLNRDISAYLCPWREDSISQGFGFPVALHQIESFIAHLDYVRFVTGFSLITLRQRSADTHDSRALQWQLFDSAAGAPKNNTGVPTANSPHLTGLSPRYPWNIILPVEQHDLRLSADLRPLPPEKIGIGDLIIGDSFITVR
ncbi:baseplate J/gp47 family protein [Dickeya chrysanthemi]|uniref:baseplate J/gp47 family protein n=1 Tax=Dickeya chrysanthemi TaxID=556 RepID=UPI001CF2A9C9|nr:baseplate J/gp47 family protein [Dickeya chrysanthemi]MCA7006722.1 baseplate J/gp47 family protein [Dickeya chrysanthemi]